MTSALELLKALRDMDPELVVETVATRINVSEAADAAIKEIERLTPVAVTPEVRDAILAAADIAATEIKRLRARAEAAEAKVANVLGWIDAGLSMSQIKHRLKQ